MNVLWRDAVLLQQTSAECYRSARAYRNIKSQLPYVIQWMAEGRIRSQIAREYLWALLEKQK